MQKMGVLPQPTEYLDPLSDIDGCYYYAVPRFFACGHPNTRWLMCMIVQNRTEMVLRKMEVTPRLFRGAYYQLVDDPGVYRGQHSNEKPVFHRQAVLYFTTVAAGIYLGHESFVEQMLKHRDVYDEALHSVESAQYATHVQDTQNGDLHAFPMFTLMMRCCKFACALPLLRHGWNPLLPVAMPLRRRHERRAMYIGDWLDYALRLMSERPTYPLSALVLGMARDPLVWRHARMPMGQLARKPSGDDPQQRQLSQQVGSGTLIDVDDLPAGGPRMLGVRTLAELVKDYDRYQQAQLLQKEAQRQLRRAQALGFNPERLLAQCQDFSAAFLQPSPTQDSELTPTLDSEPTPTLDSEPTPEPAGRNNSAKQPSNTEQQHQPQCVSEPPYASEPVRILHYALERDRHGKSVRQCLAAVDVYLKHNFYLTAQPMPAGSARLRDARNAVALLLNLLQRQMNPRGGLACLRSANKLTSRLLTHVLLQGKLFAEFALNDSFPPYPPSDLDFAYAEGLASSYSDIRLGVAREFNAEEQSCRYLTLGMLRELHGAARAGRTVPAALCLRLKFGRPPAARELAEAAEDAESEGPETQAKCCRRSGRNKQNMIMGNSNYSNRGGLLSGPLADAEWRMSPPRVTFVRVRRRQLMPVRRRRDKNAIGEPDAELTPSAVPTPEAFDQISEESEAEAAEKQLQSGLSLVAVACGAAESGPETATADAATPTQAQPQRRGRAGIARWLRNLGRRVWRRVRAN